MLDSKYTAVHISTGTVEDKTVSIQQFIHQLELSNARQ